MDAGTGGDVAGALFGLLFIGLYGLVVIFILVLSIVFIFKAMGFMKRKNEMDRELNENVRQLVHYLRKNQLEGQQTQGQPSESEIKLKNETEEGTD
ncbi:hypothetical protein [Lentibacillus sp. CBA3610]|uniref:hypothetical protein n=1 Tax=Lentibacillus sp. CBA3610 TaxID=2518176 RepID=UPI00159538DC|nr:hypothetical protein [Lentibacillus sp. CBA3610]QKY69107.1 hypothetical protein Len3610_05345 [Lentibacillus sp. CBA3610]